MNGRVSRSCEWIAFDDGGRGVWQHRRSWIGRNSITIECPEPPGSTLLPLNAKPVTSELYHGRFGESTARGKKTRRERKFVRDDFPIRTCSSGVRLNRDSMPGDPGARSVDSQRSDPAADPTLTRLAHRHIMTRLGYSRRGQSPSARTFRADFCARSSHHSKDYEDVMPVTLVVGGQWGDEGKAKIIDYLARETDIVVRYQGGANAGHTVVVGNDRFAFRQVPSGILYPRVTCVLGGGMVIDPHALITEIDDIASRGVDVDGRILISAQAHLVLPYHILLDCESEDRRSASAEGGIGTTRKGISPAYADKARREGIRAADLTRTPADLRALVEAHVRENNKILKLRGVKALSPKVVADDLLTARKRLIPMVTDTRPVLWNAVERKQHVLCEGAQGSLVDIDHGTSPLVTL